MNPSRELTQSEKNRFINSNQYIINKIKSNKPFILSRIGIGSETYSTIRYINRKNIPNNTIFVLSRNAGIYCQNKSQVIQFCKLYSECLKNSDGLLYIIGHLQREQNMFCIRYKLDKLESCILSPFFFYKYGNISPWTHSLLGKKVLIVNPFIESMKKQLDNDFNMFNDDKKRVFLKGQEFVFYKCYQTSAGNWIHSSWMETFNIMCNDIKKLDFDIALLGCGGYGLPLCNFIKTKLGKSAIYVGGVLQILFGVSGKRWYKPYFIPRIEKEYGCKFIRPSGNEVTKNNKKVEGGCYW